MRRLPFIEEPIAGESFSGFMLRLCELYGLPPGDVSEAVGYHPRDKKVRSRRSGYRLTDHQKQRITQATGLSPDQLKRMTLEHFDGRLFNADMESRRVPGVPASLGRRVTVWDTAYCPDCLREHRTMFLAWQSRWSFICVKHKRTLVEECFECGREVSILKRQGWPKDSNGQVTDVTWCWWAKSGTVCRAHLTEAIANDVADQSDLLASQVILNQVMEGEIQPTLASERVGPPEFFSDIYALMYLARARREVESGTFVKREGKSPASTGRAEPLWARPIRRQYLAEAMRLASKDSLDELTEWIRETGDLTYKEANIRLPQHRVFPGHSEALGTALEFARQTTCYADPVTRHGLSRNRPRRPPGLDPAIETRHIPQLFWKQDFENEIEEILEPIDFTKWRARRLCSVLLVRMLKPLDWEEAAAELGFEADSHQHRALWVAFSEVAKHERDWQLIAAIRRIANRHAAEGDLVDFRRIQEQMATWEGIDNLTYIYLKEAFKPIRYHHDHPRKRAFISTLIWSDLVQSDETSSPFWNSDWDRWDLTKFQQDFLPRYERRIAMFQEIVRLNPTSSTDLHLGMLISDLVEQGEMAPGFRRSNLSDELVDRTLKHVSAHTGVDIPSILRPNRKSNRPAAEVYSRLLTAHILYRLGGSFWDEIAAVLGFKQGSRCNADNQGFIINLKSMKRLDRARKDLLAFVRDGRIEPPEPAGPDPHHARMVRLAKQIRKVALATAVEFAIEEKEAILLSQLACKTHTDLADKEIGVVHDGNLGFRFVPWARGTQEVPAALREASELILQKASQLQADAGYQAAYFRKGLATRPRKGRRNAA